MKVILAVLLLASPAAAQTIWFGLPRGFFGPTGDNEAQLVSTMPDPPKLRLAVVDADVESNLGGVSFNTVRRSTPNDPDYNHDEYGLLMGRLTANKRGGAVYIAVAPTKDDAVREVFYIDNGAAIFRVPVTAPNLGNTTSGACIGDGRWHTCQQDDGNLVQYETVQDIWCPRWHVWGIRDETWHGVVPREAWPAEHVCR